MSNTFEEEIERYDYQANLVYQFVISGIDKGLICKVLDDIERINPQNVNQKLLELIVVNAKKIKNKLNKLNRKNNKELVDVMNLILDRCYEF